MNTVSEIFLNYGKTPLPAGLWYRQKNAPCKEGKQNFYRKKRPFSSLPKKRSHREREGFFLSLWFACRGWKGRKIRVENGSEKGFASFPLFFSTESARERGGEGSSNMRSGGENSSSHPSSFFPPLSFRSTFPRYMGRRERN